MAKIQSWTKFCENQRNPTKKKEGMEENCKWKKVKLEKSNDFG